MNGRTDHILHSAAGKFDTSTDSKAADVARIIDLALAAKPPQGLLLHFHGGLISKASGEAIAGKLLRRYQEAGSYPMFFIWESGLRESLLNNREDIAQDLAFRELVKKVSEWVLKRAGSSFGLKGAAGQSVDVDKLRREYDEWFDHARETPPLKDDAVSETEVATKGADDISEEKLAEDIEDGLENDPQFKKAIEEAYNAQLPADQVATRGAGTRKAADVTYLSKEARREMFGDPADVDTKGLFTWLAVARFTAKIVKSVLKRFRAHRDHGAYCTIVEEVLRAAYIDLVGSTIWNQMKKDTLDSFQDGADFCGSGVVRCLREREQVGQTFPQITLVGHSTGAIYICNFLDAAKAAGLQTPIKVAFLAPALTHGLFAKAISNHDGTSRMRDFRLFGMQDELEADDRMAGVVYPRSLLYFVSGLLEGEALDGKWKSEIDMPIAGMQRYLTQAVFANGEFPDIKTVATFFSAQGRRVVWSPSTAGPGLNSNAARHGDFDDDDPTMTSVGAFISERQH